MTTISWAELGFCVALLIGGFFYLHDAPYWARNTYVGRAQYGDAEFWWNGALHLSQGIIADNPNLTYRMGYAVFGGLLAAVCGPDYRVFHKILLSLFLLTSCGLYFSLRGLAGRLAAAAAVVFLVFNPYTAEWIAVSTSDGLGLLLDLCALLSLIAAVRGELRFKWIAWFGLLFSCASLTRPLLTPFIVCAAIAVVWTAWGRWRVAALGLGVMAGAFLLPTLAWMGVMAATTGNFALTGASQDSSSFYAASDPQIQVWRGDMYAPVREAAMKTYHTATPSPRQINAEFWAQTRANYRKHWRYHRDRLAPHILELARFTPEHATYATPPANQVRAAAKWIVALLLVGTPLWRRQWAGAGAAAIVGGIWAHWPTSHPSLVLGASALGLAALFLGSRPAFLWASYWWVGVLALYLTGGTWGPPLGPTTDLNALGYRLGFQFLFAGDLLVICSLGCLAQLSLRGEKTEDSPGLLARPSLAAARVARTALAGVLISLGLLLVIGAGLVGSRVVARARQPAVAYPRLDGLATLGVAGGAKQIRDLNELRTTINTYSGERLLTTAMSSGFIFALPGQQRTILLLYQQDRVSPVDMSPRRFDVEVSHHLNESAWMNRQGAWLVRSFPDTAQLSNLPYYLEASALQAFVPLSRDGHSYDLSRAEIFPLAKSATQLVASGELVLHGPQPEWSLNSGTQRYPRRFALHTTAATGPKDEFFLNLVYARGSRTLRFGVQLESSAAGPPRTEPVSLRLMGRRNAKETTLWQGALQPADSGPAQIEATADSDVAGFHLVAEHLLPTDTLWFYELVLTADDFTQ